jgi:hypothetical protein
MVGLNATGWRFETWAGRSHATRLRCRGDLDELDSCSGRSACGRARGERCWGKDDRVATG